MNARYQKRVCNNENVETKNGRFTLQCSTSVDYSDTDQGSPK